MDDQVIDAPQGAGEQISTPEAEVSLRDTISAAVAKQREPEAEAQSELKLEPKLAELEKPAEKTEEARARDEQGRFAKGQEKEAPKPDALAAKVEAPEAPKAEQEQPQALKPPSSWSPTAKVAFDKLPPEVQQAVAKRETEVNNGFAKLAEYKPIDPYVQMAKESGTTLDQALNRYVAAETELKRDFVNGVTLLAKQSNINPVALAHQILVRHGVPSTQIGGDGQQPAHQQAPAVDLTPIQQELSALKSFIEDQQSQGVQSEIQRFASDPKHPFFDNVKIDMGHLIDLGKAQSLDDAYDMACWANKEIRALLIKQQSVPGAKADDAVQRARAADKATGGAPAAGFKDAPKIPADASIRDTIVAAVNAQRGI